MPSDSLETIGALRSKLQDKELEVTKAASRIVVLEAELSDGLALTTCPDCGSHSATSTEARANRRIAHLEAQAEALKSNLLAVHQAIEGLWLYPTENFPSGDAAADITLFASHLQLFTQQVQARMAALAQSLAKVGPQAEGAPVEAVLAPG